MNSTRTYRVWIEAAPEQVWDALTNPATVTQYGYGGEIEGTIHSIDGHPMVEFETLETDEPRRLVQRWRAIWDDAIAAEPASTLTYELEPVGGGVTKVTLRHDAGDAPLTIGITSGEVAEAGGGFAWVISDLKTLLETGSALPNPMAAASA
jgi:uncharacterized protein YndB with AHSA1/START domain